MNYLGVLSNIWRFARSYLVAVALVGALAVAFIEVYTVGTGPMPQHPPEGYVLERGTAQLQWSKGTREGDISLQVSVDDPLFGEPMLDRAVSGNTHSLTKLEPGHTYYWRLVQEDSVSPVASFEIPAHHVKY